jgi:hypothetical protein
MKSSKSNTKHTYYCKKYSLRHPLYDLSTTLRRTFEQPFDFTMHYQRHREPAYLIVRSCIHVPGYVIIKPDVHRENFLCPKENDNPNNFT